MEVARECSAIKFMFNSMINSEIPRIMQRSDRGRVVTIHVNRYL
jgi:hypothetical protein